MIREGLIPVVLGTAVTAAGVMLEAIDMRSHGTRKYEKISMVAAGIAGFGLAHIVLGTIDLVQHNR